MLEFPQRSPLKLAVLISGGGTTLRNLIQKIDDCRLDATIVMVVSSNPKARGLSISAAAGIESCVVERRAAANDLAYSRAVFDACRQSGCHLVVMGGFLTFVPIPCDFEWRVVNIHPALIPAFCGQGYFGHHVHQAVLDYGAKVTGCSVHFVDNQYDHGPLILQHAVPVLDDETAETLAARVFEAECEAYPEALRMIASGCLRAEGRRVWMSPEGLGRHGQIAAGLPRS